MSYYYDIYNLFDFDSFCEALVNLAVNSPDDFKKLMLDVPKTESYRYKMMPFRRISRPHTRCFDMGNGGPSFISDDEAIDLFVERCAIERAEGVLRNEGEWKRGGHRMGYDMEDILRTLHINDAARAIAFLLEHALPEVQQTFLNNFLSPGELARRSEVKMVVCRLDDMRMMRGNIGRYLIFTKQKDEEPQLLRFTHQASCVYYLMFLIDRYQHSGFLEPLELGANKQQFMELYHEVYDISGDTLEQRFRNLLYREEDGRIRVGRTRELIYDIRQHVDDHFMAYGEASAPYVMTAYRHLEIGRKLIVFDDDSLLHHHFEH